MPAGCSGFSLLEVLCAMLPSRPEAATKSELPASAHSVRNGLSAEAQELLRAGARHRTEG